MLIKIGKVCEILGLSSQTVRNYEKRGILRPKERSPGGTRYYDMRDVLALDERRRQV